MVVQSISGTNPHHTIETTKHIFEDLNVILPSRSRLEWKPEIVALFGRGIVYDNFSEKFFPSPLYEVQVERQHTGLIQCGLNNESKNEGIFLAGTTTVIDAANLWLRILNNIQFEPDHILLCAGRPNYIQKIIHEVKCGSDLSEGQIILEHLDQNFRQKITTFENNKNTQHDIESAINFCLRKQKRSLAIITIPPHTRRVREFVKRNANKDKINIKVFSAFKILQRIFCYHKEAAEKYDFLTEELRGCKNYRELDKRILQIICSPAFKMTATAEMQGIRDLREGIYKSVQITGE